VDLDRLRAFVNDPSGRLGRYEIVRELGRGGMSVVYEAVDPALGRRVALKVLKDPDPERLRREAAAAARLRHPGIVAVHEVGESFIAMDLVEGAALDAAWKALDLRGRIVLLEQVARAAGHAHREGVVHRDLKASNVIVDRDGRAVITDFGLARTADGADLARTGAVIGTPHAMAPEQVRGDVRATGPATDVWALGVLLHEAVSGRKPFEGGSPLEIYDRVVRGEPAAFPGPLGAVAAKALRKEPGARYPDGTAFADELKSWLEGGTVAARPAGLPERAWRGLRRNPFPWAVLGAGVLMAVALFGWREQKSAAMRAVRETARVSLDAALALRRAGRNEEARRFLTQLEDAARQAPDSPEVDVLLGRLYRVLLEDAKAEACIDRAIDRAAAYLPAWHERMLLLARRHARDPGPALEEEIRRLAAKFPSDGVARGLLAYHEGRFEDARRVLEAELARDPSLDEAWETLARARRAEVVASLDERRAAEEVYTRAIEADRGYLPHWFGRADLRQDRGSRKKDHGLDPLPDYAAAEEDLSEALRVAPGSAEAHARRGLVRTQRGVHRKQVGRDARADFDAAEADLTRAIGLDPDRLLAWTWRGTARYHRGDFADAEKDFDEALRRAPSAADVRMRRARNRAARGAFDLAEADFAESLRLQPGSPWCWHWRGDARLAAGDAAGAEAHFAKSIETDRSHFYAWSGRGEARFRLGRYAEAAADWREALALNPRLGAGLEERVAEAQRRAGR
jgi:tetratricopeptide (TPR) repeat protein/predicted Ser/Thr protein kinase